MRITSNKEYIGNTLGDRQMKETLDLVIFEASGDKIVVRVQDRHHKGARTSGVDVIQKQMLEWNNCKVVDVWYNDCPNIFLEKNTKESRQELIACLKSSNLL